MEEKKLTRQTDKAVRINASNEGKFVELLNEEMQRLEESVVIKALECMAGITQRDCDSCSFMVDKFCSDTELSKATLDLIHRLQGNNANQVRMRCDMQRKFDNLQTLCTEQKTEIERLSLIAGIVNKGVAVEIVNMQETIDKQKAKIERFKKENANVISLNDALYREKVELKKQVENLTEENTILKGNPPLVAGKSLGKTIRAKLLSFDKMKEQNAELQKQVDELKGKVKDTAKNCYEIFKFYRENCYDIPLDLVARDIEEKCEIDLEVK